MVVNHAKLDFICGGLSVVVNHAKLDIRIKPLEISIMKDVEMCVIY